ncbi:hypothetical protein [Nonomuraea sp. NPDC050643]|uniref:hypothetical protein n=1 Tax=Nonomuraea sp. NPDC050643 TaxID=3155660 RepID=UPI0033DF3ABF
MDTHRCTRPETAAAAESWRCLDCGSLWEPLPAKPVRRDRKRRTRADRVDLYDRVTVVAQIVGALGVLWWLGLRTVFFGACLSLLAVGFLLWVWWTLRRWAGSWLTRRRKGDGASLDGG